MTTKETERLTQLESNQADLLKVIEKLDEKVDKLQSSFDQLTGMQKALMWVTGTLLTISGLIIATINTIKDK